MNWADEPTCTTHRWRWVRTWNDIGFRECWLCGYCGPVVSRSEAGAIDPAPAKVARIVDPAADMDRPAAVPGRQRSRPTRAAAALRFDAVAAELAAGAKTPEVAAKLCISEARVYQIQRVVRQRAAQEVMA